MNKLKLTAFVLVSLLLTAVIALLPTAAAAVQDRMTHSEAKFDEIQTIRLDLSEETAEPLHILKKLQIFNGGNLYAIPDDQAAMSREEVLAAVERELVPYYENSLMFHEWDSAGKSLEPYLAFDSDGTQCIFWEVSFSGYDSDYTYLNLYIDDDAGKIIFIDYGASSLYLSAEERRLMMEPFTDIYFHGLGLETVAGFWDEIAYVDVEEINSGAQAPVAVRYRFGDVIYGEMTFEFYIHGQGFYNQIPI